MEVEANVWYWNRDGMRRHPELRQGQSGYIEQREVEHLLEDAYRRGFNEGYERAKTEVAEQVRKFGRE